MGSLPTGDGGDFIKEERRCEQDSGDCLCHTGVRRGAVKCPVNRVSVVCEVWQKKI